MGDEEDLLKRWGDSLAERRAQTGLSQEDTAPLVGVKHRTYQRWENGKATPYRKNQLRLAEHFGITVEELMGGGRRTATRIEVRLAAIEAALEQLVTRLDGPVDLGLPAKDADLARKPHQNGTSETEGAAKNHPATEEGRS